MPILDTLHQINRPAYAYQAVKQKILSVIFLILSIIVLLIGAIVIFVGSFKIGIIIFIVGVVLFGISRFAKLGSRLSRERAGI